MLFKNETLVRVVLGVIFCFGSAAIAKDDNSNNNSSVSPGDCVKAYRDATGETGALDLTKVSNFCQTLKGGGSDDCKDAKKEFSKALKDFKGACPAIGYSKVDDCAQAIAGCSKKDKDSDSDKRACPSQGADVEKFKDEVNKIEGEVAKLDQKKTELEPKKAELNETAQKQLQEISAKRQKAQADFSANQMKLQAEIEKNLNEQQKQALAAYQQKLAQYDQATNSLKMIPVQMAQAQIQNADQKFAEMQIDCYDKAIAKVEKKQEEDIKKIQAGTYSCGGFNSCAKRLGLGDKAAYQKLAAIYEHDCRISDRFRIAAAANQKAANVAKSGLEVQRQAIIQSQARVLSDINSFQQQAAQDKQQTYRTAALQIQAAQTSFSAEMNSLQTQEQTVTASTQGKLQALTAQENSIDQQIKVQKSFLKEKQDLLLTKSDASGGNDYDKETAKRAETNFAAADTAADDAKNACCSKGQKDSSCGSIYQFLEYTHDKVDRRSNLDIATGKEPDDNRIPANETPEQAIDRMVGPPKQEPLDPVLTPPQPLQPPPPFGDDAKGVQ